MRRFFTTSVMGLILVLVTGSGNMVSAQGNQVTGTVTAADTKLPAAGVTVSVKGTRTLNTTNSQGQYRIQVSATATTLVFSSASFLPLEVAITGNVINAELQPDIRSLND